MSYCTLDLADILEALRGGRIMLSVADTCEPGCVTTWLGPTEHDKATAEVKGHNGSKVYNTLGPACVGLHWKIGPRWEGLRTFCPTTHAAVVASGFYVTIARV